MRAVIRPSSPTAARLAAGSIASPQGLVLWLAWGVIAVSLVARAGIFPAVMTGDEIWFSEAAYNLITQGIPKRLIHADLVGSATADFLPPVTMLVQALGFLILGLTPKAVALQSILAPLGTMALIFAITRRAGTSLLWAGFASVAVIGSQIYLRAGLYIRYEALTVLCFLLYLWLTRISTDGHRRPLAEAGRGAALAFAGLSYYPLAPFVGLAALVFEAAIWRSLPAEATPRERLVLWRPALIGFAVPALLFGTYVALFPAVFAAQILGNGGSNYLAFELPQRLFDLDFWLQSKDALPEIVGLFAFLLIAGVRLGSQQPFQRALFWAALITTLPILILPFQARTLALPVMLVLLHLAVSTGLWTPRLRRLSSAALLVGGVAAMVNCALMLVTVAVQGPARDYAPIASRLDRLISEPGPVAADQRAWLALRALGDGRALHQVMPARAAPQVRIFESAILQSSVGTDFFKYVVLNADDAEATIEATPALKRGFDQRQYRLIGRIAPAFTPLPWASQAPYDLLVFSRVDKTPPSAVSSRP